MKSAIGIMGGTFNPFHNGHLQLALQAYRQFELSKVLVMPCLLYTSPSPRDTR